MIKYGWHPGLPDFRDLKLSRSTQQEYDNLPKNIDLRPFVPEIYEQGKIGSCTAQAAAAAMRIVMRKQGFSDIRPSRLFIYYNERLEQGDVDHDTGSDIRTSMRVVAKYGAPSEDQWEYNVGNWREKPPEHTYQQGVDDMVHIYFAIDQNLNDLKMCLVHGFPFNFGFSVYSSFEGDEVAKTGIVQLPTRWESQEGGHAVCCVGYDDQINSFIVQNSWGADWGDHGFFYLPYGYMINPGLAADFWTIRSLESRGDPTRKWIVP